MSDGCCQNRSGAGTYDRADINEPKIIVGGRPPLDVIRDYVVDENALPTDPPGVVRNASGRIVIDASEDRVPVFGGTLPKSALAETPAEKFDRLCGDGAIIAGPFGPAVDLREEIVNAHEHNFVEITTVSDETQYTQPGDGWFEIANEIKDARPSKQGRLPLNDDGETVIDEANRIINGPRAQFYGPALVNHQRIADFWNTYIRQLADARNGDIELRPHDVAWLMILLKIARVVESPSHRDSPVDTIGYAALAHSMAVDQGL